MVVVNMFSGSASMSAAVVNVSSSDAWLTEIAARKRTVAAAGTIVESRGTPRMQMSVNGGVCSVLSVVMPGIAHWCGKSSILLAGSVRIETQVQSSLSQLLFYPIFAANNDDKKTNTFTHRVDQYQLFVITTAEFASANSLNQSFGQSIITKTS